MMKSTTRQLVFAISLLILWSVHGPLWASYQIPYGDFVDVIVVPRTPSKGGNLQKNSLDKSEKYPISKENPFISHPENDTAYDSTLREEFFIFGHCLVFSRNDWIEMKRLQ